MAEKSEKGFKLPKYGVLFSVRHNAKQTNDLLNSISIKFGTFIIWHNDEWSAVWANSSNHILREDVDPIWFKLHGNKYANSLELYCQDVAVLEAVKLAFTNDFQTEVQVKEGLC